MFDYPEIDYSGVRLTVTIVKWLLSAIPMKGLPSNTAFHPTIQTVGFQTAFSVILYNRTGSC